jgi:hypothetical protein
MPVFEHHGIRTAEKQEAHSLEASKVMEEELKTTIVVLTQALFGQGVTL